MNTIRGMASTCLTLRRDFKDKMDRRYKATLGFQASKRVFLQDVKRFQYASFANDDFAQFRATIVAKVVSICFWKSVMTKCYISAECKDL